jgi:predicted Zn-dependent peptidase
VLWLESDRVATLADAVTKERFENQREVVRNERRQGLENQPYGRWMKLVGENLYPHRRPYASDVIGTHEDLVAATVDDLKDFFRTYCTPNNLFLAIAGGIQPAEALRLAQKYFGGIPAGPALDRPPRWIPALDGERTIEVRDRVPQERTYFAFHSPAYFSPGDAGLDLRSTILTDGLSSRLNKVLVYEKHLCSDVVSFQMSREAAGMFIVHATAKWLNTRNRLLVRFRPETSGRETQVALDRAQAPPLGADRPFLAPQVKSGRLENGLEVLVIERRELPKVAVQLVTKSGSAGDPAGKAGRASLTVETMRMGARTRKTLAIEEAMGELGSAIWAGISREYSNTGFEVLKRNLWPAMAILADVVRDPGFPDSEVDLQKKRRLDALSQQSQSPDGIAERVGPMLAFGPNHPYGTPSAGLPGTVQKLTREDFVQFHERHWKPGSSALIFAGDVSLDEAMALAKESFGTWSGGARTPSSIPRPQPVGPGKVFLIDRQDAPQTMVVQIVGAPPRKSEEYFALRLAGAWGAGGTVRTDKTKESVAELLKELNFLAGEKPVTPAELAQAKANRVRGYAQQFETLDRVNGQVAELWALGLPLSQLQREPLELERTPLAAVNALTGRW